MLSVFIVVNDIDLPRLAARSSIPLYYYQLPLGEIVSE